MARSKLEATLDLALKALYPHDRILEDMPIKVKGKTLYVDRVIKGVKIAIEMDGRQHDQFVEFFHRDGDGFKASQQRDQLKEEWLEDNGYTIVRFKHNDTVTAETVRAAILEALNA